MTKQVEKGKTEKNTIRESTHHISECKLTNRRFWTIFGSNGNHFLSVVTVYFLQHKITVVTRIVQVIELPRLPISKPSVIHTQNI